MTTYYPPFSVTATGVLKDRLGSVIGLFPDPQKADFFAGLANAAHAYGLETLSDLGARLMDADEYERKIDRLEAKVEDLEVELDELRPQNPNVIEGPLPSNENSNSL